MPRLTISLPEELGSGGETGRANPEAIRRDLRVGRRTDGSGEPEPTILRWFATWASGASVGGERLR